MDTVSSKAAAAGVLQDCVEVCVRPMQTINLFMLLGKHSKLNCVVVSSTQYQLFDPIIS